MCFNYHFHKKIWCYKGRCVYSHFYINISTLFFLNKSSIVLKEDVVLSLSLSYVYSYFFSLFFLKNLTLTLYLYSTFHKKTSDAVKWDVDWAILCATFTPLQASKAMSKILKVLYLKYFRANGFCGLFSVFWYLIL